MKNFPGGSWEVQGGAVVAALSRDLQLLDYQAAGIVGNLGAETDGFRLMQEMRPQSGRGGYGWAQWTGPRRRAFEQYAAERSLDAASAEANYGFLLHEFRGSHAYVLEKLRGAASLAAATQIVHREYETPQDVLDRTYTSYSKRLDFAQRALAGAKPKDKPIKLVETAIKASNKTTIRLQTRLRDAGFYRGEIDGDFGPQTRTALLAYIKLHHE